AQGGPAGSPSADDAAPSSARPGTPATGTARTADRAGTTGTTGRDGAARGSADARATQGTAGTGTEGEGGVEPGAEERPVPQLTSKQASRINAPIRGMVISMVVLILLLLPFLWLQPKPDAQPYRAQVDVSQEAKFAGDQAPFAPADPRLGEGWSANYARWTEKSQEGVPLWNVGYLTPDYHLVDMAQTTESNPTWLAQRTELIPQTGEKTLGGVTWHQHHRDANGRQEEFTAWVGELEDSTVVLSGKAPEADFEHVATALSGS
ncbi:DUF4245 domain-containing protein, partial [Kocuria tytonicola]|uniref:DUF4245 domain-containing protein n=1 Tax=Kocuria tytonicola TaxID=2055946 RepID=UPI001F0C4DAD